jgi:hypothetical protein
MPLATQLGTWNIGTVKTTSGSTAGTISNMGIALVAQTATITAAMNNAGVNGYFPLNIWLPIGAFVTSVIFDVFQEARGSQCPGGNIFPQIGVFTGVYNTSYTTIGDTSNFIVADGTDYIIAGNTRYVCPSISWNNNLWAGTSGSTVGNPNLYLNARDKQVYFNEATDNIGMVGKVTVIYGLRNNIYNAS